MNERLCSVLENCQYLKAPKRLCALLGGIIGRHDCAAMITVRTGPKGQSWKLLNAL